MVLIAACALALSAVVAAQTASLGGGPGEVLARVGDFSITRAELEARIKRLAPGVRSYYETPQGRIEMLQQIVRIEVFSRRAKELHMDEDPSFQARMAAVEKTFLAADYARIVAGRVEIPESDIRAYYETHPERFHVPEKIKAPSIVIKVPAGATDAEISRRVKRMNEARARALRGEPFPNLVTEYSESTYAGNDGFFGRGRLAPAIEEQVFALRVGEVSPVLRVHDALLLFKLEARKAPYQKPFEEVREEITKQLKEERKTEALTAEEGLLYQKYGVVMSGHEPASAPGAPSITGTVVQVRPVEKSQRGGPVLGWVTVATKGGGMGPTMVVTVRDSTRISRGNGPSSEAGFKDLKRGQVVSVGFVGPVTPTAPPRVDASAIEIRTGNIAKAAAQPKAERPAGSG